ncbi:NADH-quinone oxidoreductase subunit J [Snodgrassella alvi]|uniref:NADH-quinone oxidoreductase subunit J n=1 Tax=Snodgrassella alvi TaxID=1196083 RepID=UPI000C1E3048|nr:NADH-quinone oxidoreductase subunit J [Snodgrassella alvi]PIT16189.1 NADH:ubiquinone oxidoreductase subunit J [Snodgrassella alvi]PIT19246.1 NADH:ubiquinone oxidoreductase subunit J [Snodgrassella alvi]
MNLPLILFYVFAAVILLGAINTVIAKNPVHAVLFLVLTFCASAMMWILMQAEFLGIVLVVVYVGAVMVLFLFVIMMLNIDIEQMRAGFWRHAPIAALVGILTAALLIVILVNPQLDLAHLGTDKPLPADYSNVRDLGMQIYTTYLLPFELAAILLVLGMVAAIALVHRQTHNPRRTNPAEQVKVQAKDRFRMVKMQPEVTTPVTETSEEVTEGEKKA